LTYVKYHCSIITNVLKQINMKKLLSFSITVLGLLGLWLRDSLTNYLQTYLGESSIVFIGGALFVLFVVAIFLLPILVMFYVVDYSWETSKIIIWAFISWSMFLLCYTLISYTGIVHFLCVTLVSFYTFLGAGSLIAVGDQKKDWTECL
jgi:hypothetical protein